MTEKKKTFEETFRKLEETSEILKSDNISLEEAIKNYEKGIKYYKECREILKNAEQKIETIDK